MLGGNISDNIDAGLGAEQDLVFGWESEIAPSVTLAGALAFYGYPLADKKVAGATLPLYVEPLVAVSNATAVNLKLAVSYFHGIQKVLESQRYVYVNPTVSHGLTLSEIGRAHV